MRGYYKDSNGLHWQTFSSLTPWNKAVYVIESIVYTIKYILIGLLWYGLLVAVLAICGN